MAAPPKADRVLSCPRCDAKVTGKERECPHCHRKFGKETKFRCPSCGGPVSRRMQKCPTCQSNLYALSEPPELEPEVSRITGSELAIEPAPPEKTESVLCTGCGAQVDPAQAVCPSCGKILSSKLILRCPRCGRPVEVEDGLCPACGISLKHSDWNATEEAVPGLAADSPESGADRKDSQKCSLCGAMVPMDFEKCPLCGTVLPERSPRPAAVEMHVAPEPPELPAPDEAPGKIAPQPRRQRKLKSATKAGASAPMPELSRSRTTDIGQINGLKPAGSSMSGGKGAVNGTGLVNGTGMTNGSRSGMAPSQTTRQSKHRVITRWKFLAVLVAIVVVVPVFIFLSYTNKSEGFSVDGEFGDWAGVATYGVRTYSASASCNVTEWAVGSSPSSDVFLYFKTQAPMMSSTDPESYYLFVDSDGTNQTGYEVESIGADFLFQITGWDSEVMSASLGKFPTGADKNNWSSWASAGPLSCAMTTTSLEAGVTLPETLQPTAKFVLVSQDQAERGSVGYIAPLSGGTLVVRQAPSPELATTGIVPRSPNTTLLALIFSCFGAGGQVSQVSPVISGVAGSSPVQPFSIAAGEVKKITVTVDTSSTADHMLVSSQLLASGITSSFSIVQILGSGASGYVSSPPSSIIIDGAFADWKGRLSVDQDVSRLSNADVDIAAVGNVSTVFDSFFYVSVRGDICSGTFVPATVSKPSGGGGGGAVVLPRRTAEDSLNIYIDSDRSGATGEPVPFESRTIGADQKIEVRGLFGRIVSTEMSYYSTATSGWLDNGEQVDAAKDDSRIELGVTAASIGGSSDIDFVVETTTWEGRADRATYTQAASGASIMTWSVEPITTSPFATSMSYQRKMFYDGVNWWSFFFDGTTTVHKYSTDDGQTWTAGGAVFATPNVNETSIWYDASSNLVYAIGDTASASNNVSIQTGSVDAVGHKISWSASDAYASTSTIPIGGKNTYICKDQAGYLWLSSTNLTQTGSSYQLSVFRSRGINSTATWDFSGQMLAAVSAVDNMKGSVVPAGTGSDVWALYGYGGNVAARKYNGTWQPQQIVYAQAGSKANTDNSPPSVVVDGKGTVHVVYGTGRRSGGGLSAPSIEYAFNNTGLTTFTVSSLDPAIALGVGDFYPTISLDKATDGLHVMWLQGSATSTSRTVVYKKGASGAWSDVVIDSQTTFPKVFLTSPYSIPGESKVCWQWTQNATAPIEVMYDSTLIPEFGDLALPLMVLAVVLVIFRRRRRGARETPAVL